MNNIAVIGLGGLGIRHFQAILNCSININIYAVDISQQSIDKAKQMAESISNKKIKSINYLEDIDGLPPEISIAVIATSSDVRAKIIKNLLSKHKVKYMILEKILYQKMDDYKEISNLIEHCDVKVWVNCPRRMSEGYNKMRNFFCNNKLNSFHLQGGDWGLASSLIHFIDLISYVGNINDRFSCNGEMLDEGFIESKRKGFAELTGSVFGTAGGDVNFLISSERNNKEQIIMYMSGDIKSVLVKEREQKAYLIEGNKTIDIIEMPTIYQSQLSNIFVDSLINTGNCELTPYNLSVKMHIPVVEMILKHQVKYGYGNGEICLAT